MPTKDTNSAGEATFDLQSGNYSVTVTERGYQNGGDSFSIGENENITRTVVLNDATPATINVTVTDAETGNGIEGATVSASGVSVTTNSSGVASLSVPGGTHEVVANSGGYESNSTPVTVDWGEIVSISLPLTPEVEPTLIDDFERSNIDPWQNTHAEGTTATTRTSSALGPNSNRGLYVPAPGDAEVFAGLDNFPQAGGGPNNNGAWECYVRFEETGGSVDTCRVYFALQSDGSHLRWEFQGGGIGLRVNGTSELDFQINTSAGQTRILRMNEWTSDGYIDCSVHSASGTELDRQTDNIGSGAPDSGGMRVWTNYSTAASVDSLYYIS